MSKPVCVHDIKHQGYEAIHVLARGDSGALTLIGFAGFDLLLPGGLPVTPEGLHGFAGLTFIVDKIKGRLFPIASKRRSFFAAQPVQSESGPVAGL